MIKLGVIIDGHDAFIRELLDDWNQNYKVDVFSFEEISLPLSQGRINNWRLKLAIHRFIRRNDVIFFFFAGQYLIKISHLAHIKPIIVRLHSYEFFEFAPLVDWDKVDKIILVSNSMRNRFNHQYPEHSKKTQTVYCGRSLTEFVPIKHSFENNVAMLCDMVPIKRVYEVILSIYELKKQGLRLNLHLGGEPRKGADNSRYWASIQSAIKKLQLEDQVIFYGWVSDPISWLQKMDVFISNSFWEGQRY